LAFRRNQIFFIIVNQRRARKTASTNHSIKSQPAKFKHLQNFETGAKRLSKKYKTKIAVIKAN
jgi:hypothetical protein